MRNLRDRIDRLVAQSANGPSLAQVQADAAEFNRRIAQLANGMSAADRLEAERAWRTGEGLLRSMPGCAQTIAGMSMDDFRL